ncbi:MAG: efflux RND transporter periplasmic adaptor subunit [Burkholderiales bacterium]|nr:efflux RND transporter periplasmic adaptor subunit [Burkholderiales bacterium]
MKTTNIVGAVVLLAAVGSLSYLAGTRNPPPAQPSAAPGSAPAKGPAGGAPAGIVIEARAPQVVKLPQSITTVGSLRSDEAVIVRPEIAGRVVEIAFREGQRVTRDQVLVRLDDSIQKADLERARANLTLSKSKYERARDLRAQGFISGQAKDEAENNLKVAQADVELAAARLAKTEVRAPFGGIIGLRSVSVGDYVKEGQDMVNLEEIDPLKVDFRVPEVFLSQVKAGQVLQITMDALPDRTWPGQVYAINPLVDANGRAIAIRAQVANTDGRLRPGMFARVRLLTSEVRDSLMIPEESIFPVGDDKYVYKVVDGRAQRQKVEIGQRRDSRVEILGGLSAADTVVTAGIVKLRDGAPVKVANSKEPAQPVGKADPQPPRKGDS